MHTLVITTSLVLAKAASPGLVRKPMATVGPASLPVRFTAVGEPNPLPQLQVQASYAGAETTGYVKFETRAQVLVPYNTSALCADPKGYMLGTNSCIEQWVQVHTFSSAQLIPHRQTSRLLPYQQFNQYRSERVPTQLQAIRLEDTELAVDITPQFGGKVYGMTDLATGRPLLHSPAIHQPVMAAKLDAQVDGGIEWNYSPGQLGHWAGTEQDVYLARLDTPRGPLIRVYEYERFNGTYFQVDMMVVNGTLFAHPKVFNTGAEDLTGYWWTCVGMRLTTATRNASECLASPGAPGTRVLTPASYNVNDKLEAVPFPVGNSDTYPQAHIPANGTRDMSFLSSWRGGNDNFVRILSPRKPHVTVVDQDLFGPAVGLYHGHPLNGTKYWVGGSGQASKRWYNWKDAPASPNPPPSGPNGGGLDQGGCFFEPQNENSERKYNGTTNDL
eukprot:gene752-2523_t